MLLGLSQSTYIDKMLNRFIMEQFKRGYIPMSNGITLSKSMRLKTQNDRTPMSMAPYASVIGSILCIMLCTKPNVSYALRVTTTYQSNPGEGH